MPPTRQWQWSKDLTFKHLNAINSPQSDRQTDRQQDRDSRNVIIHGVSSLCMRSSLGMYSGNIPSKRSLLALLSTLFYISSISILCKRVSGVGILFEVIWQPVFHVSFFSSRYYFNDQIVKYYNRSVFSVNARVDISLWFITLSSRT